MEVRAPLRAAKSDIDRFIAGKDDWIRRKLADSIEQKARREEFSLNYGSPVLYRAKQYPITARDGARAGFDGASFFMPPGLSPAKIKAVCIQIYRRLAKRYLTAKTLEYAKAMSVEPSGIRINGANMRWGSCSARKYINYSWRLILAADYVIDYVIVHELTHLKEMNHSRRFWEEVSNIMPDYQGRRHKLKELQRRLSSEDWR